jgi:hypothetical protein
MKHEANVEAVGFRGTTEDGWLWECYAFESFVPESDESYWFQWLLSKFRTRNVGISKGLVPVDSSFSGGVFLTRELFMSKVLDSGYKLETIALGQVAICEHVPFFRQINWDLESGKKCKRFFINTNMITTHTAVHLSKESS